MTQEQHTQLILTKIQKKYFGNSFWCRKYAEFFGEIRICKLGQKRRIWLLQVYQACAGDRRMKYHALSIRIQGSR